MRKRNANSMSRLHRPHIPVAVRLQVALRQVKQQCEPVPRFGRSDGEYLKALLWILFQDASCQLDHNPALTNRERDGVRYIPDANDPDYLIYRTKAAHDIKTRVRGDGAQLSDLAIARKRKRKERKVGRPKHVWPSRKLQSRSSFARRP